MVPRPLPLIPKRVKLSPQALFSLFTLEKTIQKSQKDVLIHVPLEIELVPVELVGNAVEIVGHGLGR